MSRILVLTFTEVVQDPRVMRHVAALQPVHDVVTCGQGPAPGGVAAHYALPAADHLPRTPAGLAALALRRADRAYAHLPAANQARRVLQDAPFDLVIANDINAVPVALELAAGRPVVADLHEYAPRQFEGDWRWRLMVQPFNEELCRRYLPACAAVTTVCDGIGLEYQREFGVPATTVTNAAPYRGPQRTGVPAVVRAVHSGAAQPNRRLELMMGAAADLPGLTLDLYLVSTAATRPYLEQLRSAAAATSNVRVLDPVPMAALPAVLDGYDLGIFVLPPDSFNARFTLPNKFFDFVQSGLGVLIGPSPEMARLVDRHGLGQVLPDFAEGSLRAALSALEPEQVARWKAASCRAAEALSAQSQAEALRTVVAQVLDGGKG